MNRSLNTVTQWAVKISDTIEQTTKVGDAVLANLWVLVQASIQNAWILAPPIPSEHKFDGVSQEQQRFLSEIMNVWFTGIELTENWDYYYLNNLDRFLSKQIFLNELFPMQDLS